MFDTNQISNLHQDSQACKSEKPAHQRDWQIDNHKPGEESGNTMAQLLIQTGRQLETLGQNLKRERKPANPLAHSTK